MTDPTPSPFAAGWELTDESATRKVADSTRELISAVRRTDAPTEVLERAASLIAEATAMLAEHRVEGMPMQGRLGPMGPSGDGERIPSQFFPWSPIIGPLNPMSAAMEISFDETSSLMTGSATFDTQFNGPPGMVHGGIIALAFDELLGATNVCLGLGGFTGTLSIRYERPTPIETEVQLEARLDRVEGRKVFTVGTISHDGVVTARAEGIFITTQNWRPPTSAT